MLLTSRTRMLVPLAALAVAGCAQPARVNRQTEEQAIRAAGAEWRQNVAAREIDKIVALHTSDAFVMNSNMPSATGSAGVRASWAGLLKMPGMSLTWSPTQIDVAESGELATEVGTYQLGFDGPGGKVNDAGSYTTVWRKVGGRWMVASDATVSSTPMPMPAPAPAAAAPAMMTEGADMDMRAGRAIVWNDLAVPGFAPGMKIGVLHGDPGATGDYTIRLKFPDGYKFPEHWHPVGEHLTVLSGTFLLAMAGNMDPSALKTYEPGDFIYIPARNSHNGGARGVTVIQLHGQAPFTINLGSPK